ncbi:acyltransferase [Providencia sp. PROV147]|uniref:acyltransferase n=1 Tax=Providencia sp. PROV147 TaxID=2949857 RepID=UPI0023496B74|nr:acyltransferase [Providencia sp. PROV147]
MKQKILLIYTWFIRTILIILPDMPVIMRFRGFLYSFAMKSCGKNFQVSASASIRGIQNISCGNHVYFGPNSYIFSRISIVIHDEVLIAMNSVIIDSNHGKDNNSYRYVRGRTQEVIIEKGAWIAANSVVTAGSHIKEGTIVPPCTVTRYK